MEIKSTHDSLLKHPEAFLPIVMSLIALTMVLAHFAFLGLINEPDEGTAAHIFQLLMLIQLPVIAYFAYKWVQKTPGPALNLILVQAGLWITTIASIYFLSD